MLGYKSRAQLELFVTGSLQQLVPEDHVLAGVDRVLDLGWLREAVADCYCADNCRPGIDPEVACCAARTLDADRHGKSLILRLP